MRQNMSRRRAWLSAMRGRLLRGGANMKFGMIFAILVAAATACRVTGADAGQWNYGCKGNVSEGAAVFDRNALLIMPSALAEGDIAGLAHGEIIAFDAADNNSG